MTAFALFLVLFAALVHATWNIFLKKARAGRAFWWVAYVVTAVVCLPILLVVDPGSLSRITPQGWFVICLSAPIHVIYGQILQFSYKKADYSVVYPTARGTGPLMTVIAAIVVLGEVPSTLGLLGIVCILGGVIFLSLQGSSAKPGQNADVRTGLFWGTVTGAFIAAYSFCDAWAVQQQTGLTPLSFYFPSIAIRALIFAPFVLAQKGWKDEIRTLLTVPSQAKSLAIVTVGSPLAYITVLFAMTMAPLAYVAPTRETGMMLGVVLGALFLKEKMNAVRLVGVAAMTLGVVLIGYGG